MIVGTVILAVVSLLFFESQEEYPVGWLIEMVDTNTVKVNFKGDIEGELAAILRLNIDMNGDGRVEPDEVKEYPEHIRESRMSYPAYDIMIDYEFGKYSYYNLALKNAIGDVDSEAPIPLTISAAIDWSSIDVDKGYYYIEISTGEPNWPFRFYSPSGYRINSVGELDNESHGASHTTVAGTTKASDVHIGIIKTVGANYDDVEPNNRINEANPISDGDMITGIVEEYGDEFDYYEIFLHGSDNVSITLTGPREADFDLTLLYSGYTQVDSSHGVYSNESISHTVALDGDYYIRVDADDGAGCYLLEVNLN